MDQVERFAADALAALRAAAAEPGPAAIVWDRDREGLALAGLVQAAFAGPGPFTILVDPGADPASAAWRERLARSWDLDLLIPSGPPGPGGVLPVDRLDRVRGRWHAALAGPFPVRVAGLRADRDPGDDLVPVARHPAGSRHLPLLDWDEDLLTAWLARIGVEVPVP